MNGRRRFTVLLVAVIALVGVGVWFALVPPGSQPSDSCRGSSSASQRLDELAASGSAKALLDPGVQNANDVLADLLRRTQPQGMAGLPSCQAVATAVESAVAGDGTVDDGDLRIMAVIGQTAMRSDVFSYLAPSIARALVPFVESGYTSVTPPTGPGSRVVTTLLPRLASEPEAYRILIDAVVVYSVTATGAVAQQVSHSTPGSSDQWRALAGPVNSSAITVGIMTEAMIGGHQNAPIDAGLPRISGVAALIERLAPAQQGFGGKTPFQIATTCIDQAAPVISTTGAMDPGAFWNTNYGDLQTVLVGVMEAITGAQPGSSGLNKAMADFDDSFRSVAPDPVP